MLRSIVLAAAAGAALLPADPVLAQANANAVTAAGDAFGFRNGDEAVGIYDETSVRGFDLEAAGNYRLNGTYFVRNSGTSGFFVQDTTVRIGYNTLSLVLPGPSGVVDYRLRDPERGERNAITLGLDAYSQPYAELHLKHRSEDGHRSYSLGAGRVFDVRDAQGGRGGESLLVAGAGRLTSGKAKAQLFFGEYQYARAGSFRVATTGDALPPRIARGRYLGQHWTREEGQRRIAGALLDVYLSDRIGLGATAAFSQEDPTSGFTQIFTLQADGTARAIVIAVPQQRSTAWSGELRGYVERPFGRLEQRLDLVVRGRVQRARVGGASVVDLGVTSFGEPAAAQPRPDLNGASPDVRDEVDQWGMGVSYRASLGERIRINAGLLRTDYRKGFVGGDRTRQSARTAPWLYNAGLGLQVVRGLHVYGSYSRGLEEAGVAPATASNRNQVLPAIIVTQREFGLRYSPDERLSLVVAAFDTRKPYAGIDGVGGAYGFLGEVRHRGVEASLSARPRADLAVVLGGVIIDPRLTGGQVAAGRVGGTPVGVPRVRAIASVDQQVASIPGLSFDAGASFVGASAARSRLETRGHGQLRVESAMKLNLGLRYRFSVAGTELVARVQGLNVLDQYGWEVDSSETLSYSAPRTVRLVLTALF